MCLTIHSGETKKQLEKDYLYVLLVFVQGQVYQFELINVSKFNKSTEHFHFPFVVCTVQLLWPLRIM